jgi:hypothetical protein
MMKKLLTILTVVLCVQFANAQNDTLLYENFDVDPTAAYLLFNSGNDQTWVNFDADGLPDANARPQEWFWSDAGFATVDANDGCLFSSSWLTGFLPGNRNWLMTPPIFISDANAVLSWTAAPRQTPRYVDGYSVLVSTSDNLEASFTDTLFQAAQYESGAGNDWSAYTFSAGFVHGLDGTYIEFDTDSSAFIGEQQPFSVPLAQYSGQTIYITFLHDADDDNLISIDDILVTGTLTGLNDANAESGLVVFPNPANDKIELSYILPASTIVSAEIFDIKGSLVTTVNRGMQLAGSQKLTVDVSSLAAGTYSVVLKAAGNSITTKFVKE